MASQRGYRFWLTFGFSGIVSLVWASDPSTPSHQVRNVVIVTLDTTRADVLSAYATDQVETPALDRLSREGTVFEQATTTVPLTLPAHCSLFTGLIPPHHGVRDNVDPPLGDAFTTLAEVLRGNGARTAAFVGSAVVDARRGLAQGFDLYSDGQRGNRNPRLRRPANVVVDEANAWLVRQQTPFFAWVHLYDAHAPHTLPEPYRTMYEDVPYLGAIAFMDSQLQRLLKVLDDHQQTEHTMVIVAADHGESLGDHGEAGHGIFVYQSTVRIPLIVRVPRFSPKRVSDLVRIMDVMPTVLDVLGVHERPTDGTSLVGLMTGRIAHLDLDAYSESLYPRRFGWAELRTIRAGRFKFVSAPRPELYDLEKDPAETRNLYHERIDLAAVMNTALDRVALPSRSDVTAASAPESELVERLAALGYVTPTPVLHKNSSTGPLEDPKDCIGTYNTIVRSRGASPDARGAPVNRVSLLDPRTFGDHVPCSTTSPLTH